MFFISLEYDYEGSDILREVYLSLEAALEAVPELLGTRTPDGLIIYKVDLEGLTEARELRRDKVLTPTSRPRYDRVSYPGTYS